MDEPGADQGAPYLEGDGGPGIRAVRIRPSLYDRGGLDFIDFEKKYEFGISPQFIYLPGEPFDAALQENFDDIGLGPAVLAFANHIEGLRLYYNVGPEDTEWEQQPPSAFGFTLTGNRVILRGLELARTANLYHMEFTDEIYSSDKGIGARNIEFFRSMIDVMFGNGGFYVFGPPFGPDGGGIFIILAPCTGYHGFLIRTKL